MSKKSVITGKGPNFGNNVPFSHKKSRRRWDANIQDKRVWVPELKRFVKLRLTASDLRSIDRFGLNAYLKKNKLTLGDVS